MNATQPKHISDYLNNNGKQMKLAIQLVSGYGGEFQSWRLSESDANSYTNIDTYVDMAKTAEKGKIHSLFIADTPSFGGAGGGGNIARKSPAFPMEPMVMLSAVAYATQKIGIVATFSTTYNLPYNLARQLKTLDVISGGRMGWNAVTTGTPQTAYNFGNQPLPSTQVRYDMSDEMVRVVQTLWATWGKDAWIADKTTGEFADMSQIRPANFDGKYFQVQGALPIPPSPQGQPPIFQAGGGQNDIELAGKFASGVYAIHLPLKMRATNEPCSSKVPLNTADRLMTSICFRALCLLLAKPKRMPLTAVANCSIIWAMTSGGRSIIGTVANRLT